MVEPSAFHLIGVDLFGFNDPKQRYNVASHPKSIVHTLESFTFIINMIVPGPENLAMVFYYQPSEADLLEQDTPFADLLRDFMKG